MNDDIKWFQNELWTRQNIIDGLIKERDTLNAKIEIAREALKLGLIPSCQVNISRFYL